MSLPTAAEAASTCGTSASHTICVTVPAGSFTGPTAVTVTNSPNSGEVIATWIPSGRSAITLIDDVGPSARTNDYSFTWPTHKYLDAAGVLRLQAGSTSSAPIDVPVTLANGNVTDFQHSPSDWANYLPSPAWTQQRDPVVAAVGDGASDEIAGDALAQSIANVRPDLFLYLGDIYETGTFTENLNHYGENSMDGGSGTLWGQMGTYTQATIGNHEIANLVAWQDYFHGRPLYTSFRFGNVLFLDLASDGASMAQGSAQYNWVRSMLTSTTNPPPPCVVTFFHKPALAKDTIAADRLPMWTLLTDNGGDLVFNGHVHKTIYYKPLNDQLQLPSPGEPTMVQLVNGSGGASSGQFTSDPRVDWSVGVFGGAWLSLTGASNGGTPNSLTWTFRDTNGNVLYTGTRNCGGGSPPPSTPTITSFSPTVGPMGTSVTIDGSGFTGATDVTFNGMSVGSGGFTVDSDSEIAATVPSGATSGYISVATPSGTATSPDTFTVGSVLTFGPGADTYVRSDKPTKNYGSAAQLLVDASPIKDTLLKFTVSGVGASTVAGAKLRLYCVGSSNIGGSFYPVADNSWQEMTVTWNTSPAAGANPVASLGPVQTGTWYEVDLSSLVTGDGTYSLRIPSPSTNGANYSSKEGTAGFAPQLLVTIG